MLEQLDERLVPATIGNVTVNLYGHSTYNSFAGVGFTMNAVADLDGYISNIKITDPNQYRAEIDWGNGFEAAEVATKQNGSNVPFQVKGSHVYQSAGSYDVKVRVTLGGQSFTQIFTNHHRVELMPNGEFGGTQPPTAPRPERPTDVNLVLYSASQYSSYAGVGFTMNAVADLDGYLRGTQDTTPSHYHAWINWGDSNQWTEAEIAPKGSSSRVPFQIKGSHVYTRTGTYHIVVHAVGPDGTSRSERTATMSVLQMPSSFPGTPPQIDPPSQSPTDVNLVLYSTSQYASYAGVGFTQNVLADLDGYVHDKQNTTATDFQAWIHWGDSSEWTRADVVRKGDSSRVPFEIKGSHVYAQAGTYYVVVYAVGPDGTSRSEQTATMSVRQMPSGLPGIPPTVTTTRQPSQVSLVEYSSSTLSTQAEVPLTNVPVAQLDGYLNGTQDRARGDFTARINWGDGPEWSRGEVQSNSGDTGIPFTILGSHTYTEPGQYPVVVYAMGPDGTSRSQQTTTVTVTAPPNPDLVAQSLTWHTESWPQVPSGTPNPATHGGVNLTYQVRYHNLSRPAALELYWSRNQTFEPGQDFLAYQRPSETSIGQYPLHVRAGELLNIPDGTGGANTDLYLLLVVNGDRAITESNTGNNLTLLDASPAIIFSPVFTSAPGAATGQAVRSVSVQLNGAELRAAFRPAGGALTKAQAARIAGLDHFNWVQQITYVPPQWTVMNDQAHRAERVPLIDPAAYQRTITSSTLPGVNAIVDAISDGSGFTYNETPVAAAPNHNWSNAQLNPDAFTFLFMDSPQLPSGFYSAGQYMQFHTTLVGVLPGHQGASLPGSQLSFTWKSDAVHGASGVGFLGAPLGVTRPPVIGGGVFGLVDDRVSLTGPLGSGPEHLVPAGTPLPYRLTFTNPAAASAPVQQVVVTQQLNANLDWSTFRLTGLGFGTTSFTVQPGSQNYQGTLPMTYNGTTFAVQVTAGLDTSIGLLTVTFRSLDSNAGQPLGAGVGFLPPEDGSGRGLGFVRYTIEPRASVPGGTAIRSVAQVQFDTTPNLATNLLDESNPSLGTDPNKEALVTLRVATPSGGPAPTQPPVRSQARIVRMGKRARVEAIHALTGAVQGVLGMFTSRVRTSYRDLNADGVLDIIVSDRKGKKARSSAFSGTDLSPLPPA